MARGGHDGKLYRIICDPIAYAFQPGIADGGIVTIDRGERFARSRYPLIDGVPGNAELAGDLLRGLALEHEVEARALLVGQKRP